jgi:DNA replication protein DnaC
MSKKREKARKKTMVNETIQNTLGQLTDKKRFLTREEQDYIDANYLKNCTSTDPLFRSIIASMCVALGYGTQDAARQTEEENAKNVVSHEREMAQIIGGSGLETIIPAKYRLNDFNGDYWPELTNAITKTISTDTVGFLASDLYVHGPSHTGKSHGMAYLAQVLLERGKKVIWVNCPRLRNLYEDGITDRQSRQVAVGMKAAAIEAQVLILDDIGKDETTSSSGDKRTLSYFGRALYEIIEERQGHAGRLTLYTSEFALNEELMAQRLTQAVVNRITDKAQVIGDAPRVRYKVWLEHKANLPGIIQMPAMEVAG